MFHHHKVLSSLFWVIIITTTHFISGVNGDVFRRFHEESEARNVIVTDLNNTEYGDVVTIENFLRTYRHGIHNNEFILYNHDVIAGYAGPFPKGHPDKTLSLQAPHQASGTIRVWAMFNKKTFDVCDIDGIYDWGQLVLFTCPQPGLYQAYAIDTNVTSIPRPTPWTCQGDGPAGDPNCGLAWWSRFQKEIFHLVGGQDGRMEVFKVPGGAAQEMISSRGERIMALESWGRGQPYRYTDSSGATVDMYVPTIVSDPVRVKDSYFCYYWLYYLNEVGRDGYIDSELVPQRSSKNESSITFEILVWIAEPSAIGLHELIDGNSVRVSEYSKIVTNRFSEAGLFPCLRKAHESIEVISELAFVNEINPDSKLLPDTPHWKGRIKVHTDRLASTLTDVTFTIASRQNTASFHCFVGEIRVLIVMRNFEFVPQRKLEPRHVNLNLSNIYEGIKHELSFEKAQVYGHGIHYIGAKWSKKFQPASQRPDMVIMTNPCIVQEFAIAVGGSLYIAQGLLRKGTEDAKKVVLPFFPNYRKNSEAKVPQEQEYLRVFDVAFTPTHVAFMFSDGYVLLHTSSASKKGVAEITETMKYRPDQFVKRKWCPRSSSPKLHAMMLPIFGEKGNIIILQVYLTEGNVQMHLTPLSSSCLPEKTGFAKKLSELDLVNETDIHYNDFAAVNRTNHKTGLREPKLTPRPPPPPPPAKNIYEEPTFLLDSTREFVNEGEDPHFPPELLNPVGHVLETDLKDYNQAKIYILEEANENNEGGLSNILKQNGFNLPNDITITDVQFTVAEKQFVFGMRFSANEISDHFPPQQPPFKMMVSTMYVTNFPYLVKIRPASKTGVAEMPDEKLETVVPFPGVIYLRTKPYKVAVAKSRDPLENNEHTESLRGSTQVDYVPQFHVLGTAIPTFIVNLGDVLVYSSVEHRYAKPLHFFPWKVLKNATDNVSSSRYFSKPVVGFDKATILFAGVNKTLFDVEITEQGLISVLWRKRQRHLVQDDEDCLATEDSDIQTVVMGSVIASEGLREIKPFFRNDNVFQRITPDGEIIYGVFDVKPRAAFVSCSGTSKETFNSTEPCIEQPTRWFSKREVKVCAKNLEQFDTACRDSAYLEYCESDNTTVPDPTHACVRKNQGCLDDMRYDEEDFVAPKPIAGATCDRNVLSSNNSTFTVMSCMPKHAPREDLRSATIVGTYYQSYLQGSLESVRTMHPEASSDPAMLMWEAEEEPDICPFANFQVYHRQLDFAEVGYQLRVTAQVSYIGYGIPPEADLLVEYQKIMGVVVEISTSIEEIRDLTSIYKVVDFYFHMNDYLLQEQFDSDPAEKHHQRALKFDFDDIRAREPFNVFSITFRPSLVNSRCKSLDFFKTIQFNVGCNTFSNIRLMSEATALKPVNWTEILDEATGYQWHRDYKNWNLTLPKVHIYYQQLRNKVFKCDNNPDYCDIPYFHLYRNEIYALSFKDYLFPKFEQLLSTSSRPVSGNVVIYDLMGSNEFNWTVNKYKARCLNLAGSWYDKMLYGTRFIGGETFEHENVYYYFKDCFDEKYNGGEEEKLHDLLTTPHFLFNRTNRNGLKFIRNRNQIFIFRAVVLNTYYNRFTYCRQLDTFFMVRIAGVPIPRQGLFLWQYVSILTIVTAGFVAWYFIFARFNTWTVRIPTHAHRV